GVLFERNVFDYFRRRETEFFGAGFITAEEQANEQGHNKSAAQMFRSSHLRFLPPASCALLRSEARCVRAKARGCSPTWRAGAVDVRFACVLASMCPGSHRCVQERGTCGNGIISSAGAVTGGPS